ncbi:hypothetical protein ABL78_3163 [Leptomonas seymouri]|uniref:Kinetoplastid kinetochore protein 1 n=1 Tax=Leptomonas seymouri TaxID=5684 RepID=A0A0N1PEW8_LEPSE|nr:hypothetical protein ABL78_3163 [Leptomonas seymouri]|eukprot:KPI87754.1 hypothetical protein ABL78_3163 [Leptomonas seymouri]
MVLDLFSGAALSHSGGAQRRRRAGSSRSSTGAASRSVPRRQASRSATAQATSRADGEDGTNTSGVRANTVEDRILFNNCAAQVQRHLKAHADSPSTLHTLASYYTKSEPFIEDRPFCVSLSYATFLFHMQMARISVAEVELYVQLITSVLSQISEDAQLTHPFVQQVLRDHVFGLPSPTCRGGAHSVVLLQPQQYRAFATMTTALISLNVVPLSIVYQFQDRLETYCECTSPLVSNRALALLVQTVDEVRMEEQVTALQYVLKTKPVKMNVDFLLACYERLKRAVVDPAHGPTFGRALSIHCSELFLRFRSPIRREYVERFLYPSLCHSDMTTFLQIPATRKHLMRELLSQCTLGMGTMNPFYMCLCAVLQSNFDNETDGALETVALINYRMPHAAYFASTLAVDSHMSVSMFAKVIIALVRGAGMAMTVRETPDEVAASINENRTNVYNVLFLLREVVRSCSVTASRRATDMMKALRVAVAPNTIEALGKLSSEAFETVSDITLDPQLLCAELAMVLHQDHIGEAMDSAVEYFRDVTSKCPYCAAARSSSLLCPVNGTVHVSGQSSVSRVLSTLSECAGMKAVEERLIGYLRDPAMQMESAVHYLIYHIIANGGQHRNTLFVAVEPYVRSTLLALVSADRSGSRGLVGSTQKANVLMLHVKLVTLLASSIDPSYLESILKVFSELKLRNNHDALALWYMGNVLLRNCRGNLELLPTDPQENSYCIAYPGCAPSSATTADNAQLVLKLLHRAHSFSPEMHKLVGCCVCRLMQDFNMQAPNICNVLLSSFGFLPVGLESLSNFALPVGAGSTFWSFFLQQMRSSAPARTAFLATLAKSMSLRFRVASPADALAPYGVEPTGHLFAIMVYEAMKRNPPLAHVLLYMLSQWVKQAGHSPGKFACLLYVCVQLITVVVDRAQGPAGAEVEAETPQDRHQFDDAVRKAAKVLRTQQQRLDKLAPTVQRENTEFFHLLRRLRRRVRRVVAAASGEIVVDDGSEEEERREAMGSTYAVRELQNAADDSVFEDYAAAGDDGDNNAFDAVDADVYGGNEGKGIGWAQQSANLGSGDGSAGAAAPMRIRPLPQGVSSILLSGTQASHLELGASRRGLGGSSSDQVRDDAAIEADSYSVGYEPDGAEDGADGSVEQHADRRKHHYGHSQQQRTRSVSRGVQTDDEPSNLGTLQRTAPTAHQRNVGTSPIQLDSASTTSTKTAEERHNGGLPPSRGMPGTKVSTTPSSSSFVQQPQRSHTQPPGDAADTSPARGSTWVEPDLADFVSGDTVPIEDYNDVPRLQATAAGGRDGIVLPSGMVLEYLRTHQGTDSLRHELHQFDQQWIVRQVAEYVAQSGGLAGTAATTAPTRSANRNGVPPVASVVQSVTVEGRANNYSRPHTDPGQLAPSRTVRTAVQMVESHRSPQTTWPTVQEEQPRMAATDDCSDTETDTVDGENPIRAVSGPPGEDASGGNDGAGSEGKRRRMEPTAQASPLPPPPTPVSPAGAFRGRNFFLNHNTQQQVGSTLQDIHYLQRQQQANMSALAETHAKQQLQTENNGGDQETDTPAPRMTPHHEQSSGVASEGLPPTTPYGQVILPTWVVEQRNDTAIRELRQVMGAHNPNSTRLSTTSGKRSRIHGSGGGGDAEASSGNSGVWWAEMSSAPMPNYAADPQYSMELF